MTEQKPGLLQVPKKIYFKRGCTPVALRELTEIYHFKKALLLSDANIYRLGFIAKVRKQLTKQGMHTAEFFAFSSLPTIKEISQAGSLIHAFNPDVIIGIGGGAVLSGAKVALLLGEVPENALRNPDEVLTFNRASMSRKLVLIATSFGSGAQTSPVATFQDNESKSFVMNGEHLLPEIAVTDADYTDTLTTEQVKDCVASLTKLAKEAYKASSDNDYILSILDEALDVLENELSPALEGCPLAREKLHNAGALIGTTLGRSN